jgi:hypothetical protein
MIGQAFTADALSAARFVGAVAAGEVLVLAAFIHRRLLLGRRLRIKDRRGPGKKQVLASLSSHVIGNLGMERRPLRFSLHEALFEGSRLSGREDCLSTQGSYGDGSEWSQIARRG